MFTSVAKLDFDSTDTRRYHARLKRDDLLSTICFSSSIIHLRVSVDTFDGRLRHLRRLVIRISSICTSKFMPNDTVRIFILINEDIFLYAQCFIEDFSDS